jgi:nicotinate-nucleotide pyrophosphorylase (carboxylating)
MDWNSRRITAILENALQEDRATRDTTTSTVLDPRQRATATFYVKQDCVLAGVGAVKRVLQVFEQMDPTVIGHSEVISHPEVFDGVRMPAGRQVAVIRHNARAILATERVILNLLQRMSGIATMTRKFADAIAGTSARILDTRKTMPGLRILDKYAVRCGGGYNARQDLADGMLIKRNHADLVGGVEKAVERAVKQRVGHEPRIQVEVRTLDEMLLALKAGAESLLLDGMSVEQVQTAVANVLKSDKPVPVECSGGVTLENVRAYAETGVNYISIGALTHSATAVNMSMKVEPA